MTFHKSMVQAAFTGLALIAGLNWTVPMAKAQEGGGQLVSVNLPPDLTVEEARIQGCTPMEQWDLIDLPIYLCLPQGVHEVRDADDTVVGYGYQRLRDEIRVLEQPMAGPLRTMIIERTERAARAAGLALGDDMPGNVAAALENPDLAPKGEAPVVAKQTPVEQDKTTAFRIVLPNAFGALGPVDADLGPFEVDDADNTVRVATLSVPEDQLNRTVSFILRDNPACRFDLVPQDRLDLPQIFLENAIQCRSVTKTVDRSLTFQVPTGCERREGALRCLVESSVDQIVLNVNGFEPVRLGLAGTEGVDAAALRPTLALSPGDPALAGNGVQGPCGRPGWDVVLNGYCSSIETCSEDFGPVPLIAPVGAAAFPMPALGEAGWSGTALPNLALVTLQSRGADDPVGPFPIALGGDLPPEIRGQLSNEDRLPLSVDFSDPNITRGVTGRRMLRVYYDAACSKPVDKGEKSLRHASTRNPDVPACGGFFQVFDDTQPRSACTPLEVADNKLVARPIIAACDAKRLLVLVIENQRDNGKTGTAIYRALDELARAMHAEKAERCFPVDVWRSRDLDHDELFRGEDLRLAGDINTFLSQLPVPEFSNDNSDPVADFQWIDEDWQGQLGGVLIVGRGAPNRDVSAADRGVALTWALDGVQTHALLSGGPEGCALYEKSFRFKSCKAIDGDFSAQQLIDAVQTAIGDMGE